MSVHHVSRRSFLQSVAGAAVAAPFLSRGIRAAQTVREVASDPIGSARKQVKGLERKGTPAARKVNRRFNARLNAATAPAKDVAKNEDVRKSYLGY